MKTAQPGVDLVKSSRVPCDAYLCPAGVWTIGYGHTEGVHPGDYVSRERGEEMLREDLVFRGSGQRSDHRLLTRTSLTPLSALPTTVVLSPGWSMRKRLNAGEAKVFQGSCLSG